MNFLMEWVLAWHGTVWFPFPYFARLGTAPVEADFFNDKSEEEHVPRHIPPADERARDPTGCTN